MAVCMCECIHIRPACARPRRSGKINSCLLFVYYVKQNAPLPPAAIHLWPSSQAGSLQQTCRPGSGRDVVRRGVTGEDFVELRGDTNEVACAYGPTTIVGPYAPTKGGLAPLKAKCRFIQILNLKFEFWVGGLLMMTAARCGCGA